MMSLLMKIPIGNLKEQRIVKDSTRILLQMTLTLLMKLVSQITRYISVIDVYESCSLVTVEPNSYHEASQFDE